MVFKIGALNTKAGVLVAVMAAGLWLASPAPAAEPGSGNSAAGGIAPLNEPDARRLDVGTEQHFDLIGTLNAIDGRQVIIDNRRLKLVGPGARTFGVAQYHLVGARLNRAGEIVVLETLSDELH